MLSHKSRVFRPRDVRARLSQKSHNVVPQIPFFSTAGFADNVVPLITRFFDRGICGWCCHKSRVFQWPWSSRTMLSYISRVFQCARDLRITLSHKPHKYNTHDNATADLFFWQLSTLDPWKSELPRDTELLAEPDNQETKKHCQATSPIPTVHSAQWKYNILYCGRQLKAYLTLSCPSEVQSVRSQTSLTFHICWAHAFQRTNLGRMLSKNEHLTNIQAKRTIWVPQIVAETMPIRPFLMRDKNKNRNE